MTGRRLLPKIGMRYKVLYILAFLLCANSLFLQIESPIITIGDKWYASIILLLLFLIANSTFSMSSFSWSLNKLLPSFYIIVLLSDVVLAMHGILQYTHIIPFHSYLVAVSIILPDMPLPFVLDFLQCFIFICIIVQN